METTPGKHGEWQLNPVQGVRIRICRPTDMYSQIQTNISFFGFAVTEAGWARESQFGKAEGTGDVEKAEGTGGADPIAAMHVAAVGPRTRERA